METFLQIWGGSLYLLAKIFLAKAEKTNNDKDRIKGWLFYILGAPAWIIVLAQNHNWIAMGVEAGGILGMILGIVKIKNNKIAQYFQEVIKLMLILIGVITMVLYSTYFEGIFKTTLEIGIMIGFWMGTYLLAKKNYHGWLCFILMNTSMAALMIIQVKWIFVILQIISIFFAVYGFITAEKKEKINSFKNCANPLIGNINN